MRKFGLTVLFFLFLPAFAAAQDAAGYRLLKLDGRAVKWGAPAYGEEAIVTYAVLGTDRTFDDARNCQAMGPVDPILSFNGIERREFDAAVIAAFRTWEAISGVRFEKAADPANANILIGIDLGTHGWAHADVKTEGAGGAIDVITRGLVCLNTEKSWKIGFGADPQAQDIKYTLTHEIGHAIGLNHASPHGQVMSFNYTEDFNDLQPGDIAGAQALYGAPASSTLAVIEDTVTAN